MPVVCTPPLVVFTMRAACVVLLYEALTEGVVGISTAKKCDDESQTLSLFFYKITLFLNVSRDKDCCIRYWTWTLYTTCP